MMAPSAASNELAQQHELLCATVGPKGSGAKRYAAAMFFYNIGLIREDILEIYRRCSKFDNENPIDLAQFEGVKVPAFQGTLASGGLI